MRQILFHIPIVGLPIYGYGLMLFLGFVCCTLWAARRARRQDLSPDLVVDLAMWAFVGGLVGARVFYVVQKYDQYTSVIELLYIWKGGLVYYGGVIGGLVGFLWYVKRKHLSVPAFSTCWPRRSRWGWPSAGSGARSTAAASATTANCPGRSPSR